MRKTTTDTVELMREITRLFSRSQRIVVHYCNATSTQTHVLLELEQHGPMSLGDLGARLELGKSWTGRVVQRLVHVGAVTRRLDPGDARRRIVQLTPLGRHRVMYLRAELDHYAARLHNCRPEIERRKLNGELSGLVVALRRYDDTRDRRPVRGQLHYPVWSGPVRGEPSLI